MTSVKTYLLINFKTRKPQTWRVALVKWPPSRLSNRSGKYVIECKETLFLVGYISHWYLALSEERYCCSWNSCRQVCSRIGKQFPVKVWIISTVSTGMNYLKRSFLSTVNLMPSTLGLGANPICLKLYVISFQHQLTNWP